MIIIFKSIYISSRVGFTTYDILKTRKKTCQYPLGFKRVNIA